MNLTIDPEFEAAVPLRDGQRFPALAAQAQRIEFPALSVAPERDADPGGLHQRRSVLGKRDKEGDAARRFPRHRRIRVLPMLA